MKKQYYVYILGLSMLFSCPVTAQDALKIAVDLNQKPFSYYNDEQELTGLTIDLVNLLAEEYETRIEFVDMPDSEILPALVSSRVDVGITEFSGKEDLSSVEELVSITNAFYIKEGGLDEDSVSYVFLVRSELEEYKEAVNQVLATLGETGELGMLIEKYIPPEEIEEITERLFGTET